jgi:tRNA pseudouridine38-40 synthase
MGDCVTESLPREQCPGDAAGRTFMLTLEYDGTRFAGWQVQPGMRTVQRVVEEALERILHHPVRLNAAGRTDAGVHASGQVIGFSTSSGIEPGKLARALNGILPRDVSVLDSREVGPDFHARYDARMRTYRYTISTRRISIGRSYVWRITCPLSPDLIEESTRCLDGRCDLRGFTKGGDETDCTTVIEKNRWTFSGNLIIFEISAVRFFHHAVRSIVGSAVEVGRGKESPDLLRRILLTGDRSLAGPTAPPYGLCLVRVEYGDDIG